VYSLSLPRYPFFLLRYSFHLSFPPPSTLYLPFFYLPSSLSSKSLCIIFFAFLSLNIISSFYRSIISLSFSDTFLHYCLHF
jgi:hypothetical protein